MLSPQFCSYYHVNFIYSLRVGAILDHFGYATPSLTEWQQHIWYDLGAIHSCVYEMRDRLAMGRSTQPRSVSPVARVGQKVLRIPPESAPVASTTGQAAETPSQPSPAKSKDRRKKKKRQEDDASPPKAKRSKKKTTSVVSSDTEIYDDLAVKKEEAPVNVVPPESSDSQAEGPFTNRSDSNGTESAPESKKVSSSCR